MKKYNSPITETTVLESGILCDGNPMAVSQPKQIVPITAPKRKEVY